MRIDRTIVVAAALTASMAGVQESYANGAPLAPGTFVFESDPGAPLPQIANSPDNNINLLGVRTTFNPDSNLFSYEATFAPELGVDPAVSLPTGFVLVVNDGGHPAGHIGELATLFFDASDADDPIVSAYTYNGRLPATSFEESISSFFTRNDPNLGDPEADRIISSLNDNGDTPFLLEAASVDNLDGTRTLSLAIDATVIQEFTPRNEAFDLEEGESLTEGFQGLRFGAELGLWFQPFVVDADYFEDGPNAGFIESFARGDSSLQALFDEDFLPTTVVIPEPSMAALLAVPALLACRRQSIRR